jgi:hypothetical protein
MTIVNTDIPVGPTSRQLDIHNPAAPVGPSIETQHRAQSRGLTMEQVLDAARFEAERQYVDDEVLAASAWLRRQGSKGLVKMLVRLNRIEKALGISEG